MKIAITSPNAKTISGHAGKCPGYLIYEIDSNQDIQKTHIKLTKEQVLKNLSGALSLNTEHPLYGIDTFITQSLGEGLKNRLAQDNIKVYTTENSDPETIIQSLIN
ncbi:NifB/NifX family molybdenum-iron cluster-binding protein [Thiomicrorhabdus sp. Kp2]|uniref:NifB/NifX family molybdenum-iron cluster-binding protein n=1 Tax=Thiomicrorhabdus sp. Kp2 TaxID=1123518 RepID=UPI00040DFF71|nr:NifB/NifX family molybdenum-iron cluster-binding protein [Thiomicrorhabdus sp. Kp2]